MITLFCSVLASAEALTGFLLTFYVETYDVLSLGPAVCYAMTLNQVHVLLSLRFQMTSKSNLFRIILTKIVFVEITSLSYQNHVNIFRYI